MSRYLFRRRVTIVAALAAVLIFVPLIGWASYRLALKAARDSRPPARLRWTAGASGGTPQVRVEYQTDDARLYFEARENGGTDRFVLNGGGSGVGDWGYRHGGQFVRDGLPVRELRSAGEWVVLRPGESATLLELLDSYSTPPTRCTLRVWCLPEDVPSETQVYNAQGTLILDTSGVAEAWVAEHPPNDDL